MMALRSNKGVVANAALLAAILVHNLSYPLSTASGPWPAVFYLFYASIFVAGTWALSSDRVLRLLATATGAAVLVAGLANSYAPGPQVALAVFATSIAYHLVMGVALVRYTFSARTVMSDVVLAATSLYLVIGSGFAAILALIEWLAPGSFVASSGAAITWQQMVYYSYVTLTTVGYGDITPVGSYAQAIASFEAVLGVLYTVVLLSRLVGMYASAPKDGS
ncbi:potassium channel family protein [Nitratireductor sp. ZSWI3]|uniref:potassium channel family protein n=1 Tax=Nitratireductor sp. ZSWI3 TaxID=2966359 RepID=UPI00214FF4EF|nr:potassium channel family protein [Nitratireductor sp. ZSWI3]MCR4268036.1 potassium channel family protein [Nitratireductor sp. ZSWI3]